MRIVDVLTKNLPDLWMRAIGKKLDAVANEMANLERGLREDGERDLSLPTAPTRRTLADLVAIKDELDDTARMAKLMAADVEGKIVEVVFHCGGLEFLRIDWQKLRRAIPAKSPRRKATK